MSAFSIITLNVNGLRAAQRKGVFSFLQEKQADVICLQEVKALPEQIEGEDFQLPGYQRFVFPAEKKGYSGVAIYCRWQVDKLHYGLQWDHPLEHEGRVLSIDIGPLTVMSLYMPSGTSGDERQALKEVMMEKMTSVLQAYQESGRYVIIAGDLNIVHTERDIKNFTSNQKSSGCLPHERAWLDELFGPMAWVDVFRACRPEDVTYSWWSQRGRAYDNNVGWRIDYQIATANVRAHLIDAEIFRTPRLSDHAAMIAHYDFADELTPFLNPYDGS